MRAQLNPPHTFAYVLGNGIEKGCHAVVSVALVVAEKESP